MTDLELAANEEARHGNRDALADITYRYLELLDRLLWLGDDPIDEDTWELIREEHEKLNTGSD